MAKVQKSLLINEDLVRLLDAHQRRTGASFTRAVTAAVLQYLFQEPEGPDPYWMELAVDLELGERKIAEPTSGAYYTHSVLEERRQLQSGELGPLPDAKVGPGGEVADVTPTPEEKDADARWQKLIESAGKHRDPIEGIIIHWQTQRRT